MRLAIALCGIFFTVGFGYKMSVESGVKSAAQARILVMLEDVRPNVRSSKENIQRIIRELEKDKNRDLYEETLLQELKRWLKDPEFRNQLRRQSIKPKKSA